MKYNRKNIVKFLLLIFFTIQIVPLLAREDMQTLIIIDYSFFLSLIFIFSIRKKQSQNFFKYTFLLLLVIITCLLYIIGFSGSIAGYVLSASIPFFLFSDIKNKKDIIDKFYNIIKWASLLLVIFGGILYYNLNGQLKNLTLMTQYFIKASINYVSLLFYGFSIIFVVLYDLKKRVTNNQPLSDKIICLLLLISSIYYSYIYLTRSTFLASVFLLILFLRQYKYLLIAPLLLLTIIFRIELLSFFKSFLGSSDIGQLAAQDIRIHSAEFLISNATSFNFDFTETMSASSLLNLLFSLFPLTLYFAFDIIFAGFKLFRIKDMNVRFFYLCIFSLALFIPIYQMDFFSIFALFIIIQIFELESETYTHSRKYFPLNNAHLQEAK